MIQLRQKILCSDATVPLSFREWQKYRGWKMRILEELEHSGGMTTREISSRIGYQCHSTTKRLCEMQRSGFVEKVERWGWRITSNGIFLLSLNYTPTTHQQHSNNTPTTLQLEKEEPAPKCFQGKTCHIKQICQDKRYTIKNMDVCLNCVWYNPRAQVFPAPRPEMKVVGSTR